MPVGELAAIVAIKSGQSEGESPLSLTRGLHDPPAPLFQTALRDVHPLQMSVWVTLRIKSPAREPPQWGTESVSRNPGLCAPH